MKKIIACIDGSGIAKSVCDTAIWASKRLGNPVMFLHTIEKAQQHGADDLSGAIGLGARSALLEKMALLDEQRGKVAIQLSNEMLDAAADRAKAAGVNGIEQKQRHGDFVDALKTLENDTRLIVVGRAGKGHHGNFKTIGSHIENLIRQVNSTIMIAPEDYVEPTNFMLAYDGRATADKAVQRIIDGGLLKGLTCHLVTVKNNEHAQKDKFEQTKQRLEQEGIEVVANFLEGDIFSSLMSYKKENDIGLVVMGAFSHSKVRQFFLGSNTIRMIESCLMPLVILK